MPQAALSHDQQRVLARLLRAQDGIMHGRSPDDVDQPLPRSTDPHLREAERALQDGQLQDISVMGLIMAITAGRQLMAHFKQHQPALTKRLQPVFEPLEAYFETADLHFQGKAMIA